MMNWLQKSSELLKDACTSWGIKASLTNKDNYARIFTRDAAMAGIAGLLLEDETIISGFVNTVNQLKALQGNQGQIPSNFKVENDEISKVSFGTLSPKIDACTWYLISVGLLINAGHIEKTAYKKSVEKNINLLEGIEYNGKHLMYIPKGGNWADEYIYEGYILYDQMLRIWGLELLANIYGNITWYDKGQAIRETIQKLYKNEQKPYYHSSFYPGGIFNQFDLAAHCIAGLVLNKSNHFFNDALNWISETFLKVDKLPPAFHPVINEDEADWNSLSKFYLYQFKNKPHHFHNGGIWWIWLGWLAVVLSLWNKKEDLNLLLNTAFNYLEKNKAHFDFDEYVASDNLQLNGTKKLTFTATGIALLSLAKNGFIFSALNPAITSSIKEPIKVKNDYFDLSIQLIEHLKAAHVLEKDKLVIAIAGESGSGKSVTAKCLQIELEKLGMHSVIMHQDGYYKLTPKENHNKRKADIEWVGLEELKLDLMQQHIDQFKAKEALINVPMVNYQLNQFFTHNLILKGKTVLIVEGVYAFYLNNFDYKIFMAKTYKDTRETRKKRTRETYDPFVEQVLQIEHSLVSERKGLANLIITNEYTIESV